MNWTNCTRRYLPKTTEVMALICRFKQANSSTTGFRATSASSALLVKPDFSVSQSARSLLKDSFSFSITARAWVSSSLAFAASACCDFTFSYKSEFRASLLLSSAYNVEGILNKQHICVLSTKRITSYALHTWGLMPICSNVLHFIQVSGTMQALS